MSMSKADKRIVRLLKNVCEGVFKYYKNRRYGDGGNVGGSDDNGGGSDDNGGGGNGGDSDGNGGGRNGGSGQGGDTSGGEKVTREYAIFAEKKPPIAPRNKVVLVIGFGDSILPIFFAEAADARLVYVMDSRATAIDQAYQVIKDHNMSEKCCLFHGEVEELQMRVLADVIISEWMGHMLLYKSTIGRFITARERWLKPGGFTFPSYATLYMAPVSYPQRFNDEALCLLNEIDSIDLIEDNLLRASLLELDSEARVRKCILERPYVEMIDAEFILARPSVVRCIDCSTIVLDEEEITISMCDFVSKMEAPLNGFGFWFDVEFGTPPIHSLTLSTAPEHPPTRWKQTMVYIDPIVVEQDQVIDCFVKITQNMANSNLMKIHLTYSCADQSYVHEAFFA